MIISKVRDIRTWHQSGIVTCRIKSISQPSIKLQVIWWWMNKDLGLENMILKNMEENGYRFFSAKGIRFLLLLITACNGINWVKQNATNNLTPVLISFLCSFRWGALKTIPGLDETTFFETKTRPRPDLVKISRPRRDRDFWKMSFRDRDQTEKSLKRF